jgi:hypothetical protein
LQREGRRRARKDEIFQAFRRGKGRLLLCGEFGSDWAVFVGVADGVVGCRAVFALEVGVVFVVGGVGVLGGDGMRLRSVLEGGGRGEWRGKVGGLVSGRWGGGGVGVGDVVKPRLKGSGGLEGGLGGRLRWDVVGKH